MLFTASTFLRETPRWLCSVNRPTEALRNLSWIRNLAVDHPYVQEEYQAIGVQLEREKRGGVESSFGGKIRELAKPGIRNQLAMGVTIMMCQNLTGE